MKYSVSFVVYDNAELNLEVNECAKDKDRYRDAVIDAVYDELFERHANGAIEIMSIVSDDEAFEWHNEF